MIFISDTVTGVTPVYSFTCFLKIDKSFLDDASMLSYIAWQRFNTMVDTATPTVIR